MKTDVTDGRLIVTHDHATARLAVRCARPDGGEMLALPLAADADGWAGENALASVRLQSGEDRQTPLAQRVTARIEATADCRVLFELTLDDVGTPFHIVPGVLFGDNNLAISAPGHFPNLTAREIDSPSCAPRWAMRTDRAAAPVSMLVGDNATAAVAGPPYVDLDDGFVRTGLVAALPGTVGYAVGYRNAPATFVNKGVFEPPTEHVLPAGATVTLPVDLFLLTSGERANACRIARALYALYHQPPSARIAPAQAIRAIARTVVEDGWNPEHRAFMGVGVSGLPGEPTYRRLGGRAIAWVGGANVGYPLLAAGYRIGDDECVAVATDALDRIAANRNPAGGLLYDAFEGDDWHGGVNYWWSGNTNKDLHSAYTNAEAAWYLLRADELVARREGEGVPEWRDAALGVLDTMLGLQRDDGHFGYGYYTDRPGVANWDGFAGCWFVPAMAQAYRMTGALPYLESARRGLACYAHDVRALNCWGTPMDTFKGNDEEGVLAFIRGARLLHQVTGEAQYLHALALGAEYEFLWRYLYNARPQAEPLQSADWHSCGGSITSVSNPHIHPMGLLVAGDLAYLAERTGDEHVRRRLEDSLVWARNCLDLWPEKTGFGQTGWTGERYCPSDGLLIQTYADGSPASIENGLNLWAASAMVEGLLETTD